MNINPLHDNTNVYSIRTNNQTVKLFGIEHTYSSPYTAKIAEKSCVFLIKIVRFRGRHCSCVVHFEKAGRS